MTGRRQDLVIALALLAFAGLMWVWLVPTFAGSGDQVILPRLAIGAIGLFAALMVLGRVLPGPAGRPDDDPFVEVGRGEPRRLGIVVVVWAAFAALIPQLGFYLGGALALLATFLAFGVRGWRALVGWTLGTPVALWLAFELAFGLRIPHGTVERALLGL